MTMIFSYRDIYKAYEDCLKNKSNTNNAIEFMLDKDANLIKLCDEINDGTYQIGKSIAFVVKYPVYREVFAADFRDRIIHHLVINELNQYFEEQFIPESYSCRKDKGVLYGVFDLQKQIQECTEDYTKDAYILKCDIKSFFMSIDKEKLASLLDNFIVKFYKNEWKKERLRELCRMIVMHHPEDNCEIRCEVERWEQLPIEKSLFNVGKTKGLPIGNLTSQVFANLYLHFLDIFIKYTLCMQYYGRYVDDFAIIHPDKELLKSIVPKIDNFLKEYLGLSLHKDKRYLQHYSKGVKFIGAIIKKDRVYVYNRTKHSLKYKLDHYYNEPKKSKVNDFVACVNSYLGYMIHYKSYNIRKQVFKDKASIFESWGDYIEVSKGLNKITKVKSLKQNEANKQFNKQARRR